MCLNCGKESEEKMLCESCRNSMPAHLKKFDNDEVFDLISVFSQDQISVDTVKKLLS